MACKSEHDISVGVFRTWVKYIEKGQYPDTRRVFSVMRCNHCKNAPCVSICPVTALYIRDDGIVDFDGTRCIACKSCMQACPYDALYIDPTTQTAAKCNMCSNRVDLGLEPACVTVCPEQAITVGDLNNPNSKISKLISTEKVTVRKPEKGTIPNVFYIEGDELMFSPSASSANSTYMWSTQAKGVGHYAGKDMHADFGNKQTDVIRAYDAPDKGILWGWQVPSYLFTKSIASGVGLILALAILFDFLPTKDEMTVLYITILSALGLTALFLVLDLDQPKRFHTVLLRPNWSSWLAKGAYIITGYGFIVSIAFLFNVLDIKVNNMFFSIIILFAFLSAVYTAFLFAQAISRDYWQSASAPLDMLSHSFQAGSAIILMIYGRDYLSEFVYWIFIGSAVSSLVLSLVEVFTKHPTHDAELVSKMIKSGEYRLQYTIGLFLSTLLPLTILFGNNLDLLVYPLTLVGIYLLNQIWVYAPQKIKLR